MELKLLYLLIFFCFSNQLIAQQDSILKYHSPLEIPLVLSANFGELRPNHFHSGIDFKTNGAEGLKLYAIESGYVSRIKVSINGYGKVIYINHPNGITSVYAHCSKFLGRIDSLVKITQEKNKSYEVEIFPVPEEISLRRGENIALSGNTGSSTAPHLHFELRDTKTELALNPLKYGFDIIDCIPPEIRNIKIYSLTEKGYRIKGKSKIIPVKKGKNGYYIGGNLASIPSDFCSENGGIGFSFEVVDHYNQATNPLGIYGSYLIIDQDTIFGQRIDSISFESTRYINSHIDYEENKISKKKYQKSFRTKENKLGFYYGEKLGIINIQPNKTINIKYVAYDTKNNKSELKFKLNALPGTLYFPTQISSKDYLFPDSSFVYEGKNESINIPEGCVYEPVLKNLQPNKHFIIGNSSNPIQKPITVRLKLDSKILQSEKYYIDANSKYLETKYENGWLTAESKSFATFSIKSDTIAPFISPLNFNKTDTICKKQTMTWSITEKTTSLVDYDLYIDGKWYLLEFEAKGSYAFFRKSKDLIGKHFLKLIAKDACGNVSVWEKEMILE